MKYLIIVDVQNDFIDGVLGSVEAIVATNNICDYLAKHADKYDVIYATKDSHTEDEYKQTVESMYIPIHCIKDSAGEKLQWAIADYVDESHIFEKSVFSHIASLASSSISYSHCMGLDVEIDIIGLCTDICVISNALVCRSMFPRAKIRVIKDCCAGTTLEKHNAALEVMESCLIDVV